MPLEKEKKLKCLRLESEGGVSPRRGGVSCREGEGGRPHALGRSCCLADREKAGVRLGGRVPEPEMEDKERSPDLGVHAWEPSTWVAEAGGLPLVHGQTGLT